MGGEPAHILWTGGWDSTYRVLVLALAGARPVQPYYLVDARRSSTQKELLAMCEIRGLIAARDPTARARLRPTIIREIDGIAPHREITAAYRRLTRRTHLGSQYEWLARFAAQEELDVLELCLEKDERLAPMIEAHVGGARATDAAFLFSRFRFPILELTKRDMLARAHKLDIADILERSWFCHTPGPDRRPCGTCVPCCQAMRAGLRYRMPLRSRLRHYVSPSVRLRPVRRSDAVTRLSAVATDLRGR